MGGERERERQRDRGGRRDRDGVVEKEGRERRDRDRWEERQRQVGGETQRERQPSVSCLWCKPFRLQTHNFIQWRLVCHSYNTVLTHTRSLARSQ